MSDDKTADLHGCVDVSVVYVKDGRIIKEVTRNYPAHLKIPAKVIKKADLGPVPESNDNEHDI